jgi:hypothetical protein
MPKEHCNLKVPRLRRFVLLVTTIYIWGWAWSIDRMILTGKTKVLGEKHYTALVINVWMSMEHWWNDTEVLGEKYASATLSTTNPTWPGLGLNAGLLGERPSLTACITAYTHTHTYIHIHNTYARYYVTHCEWPRACKYTKFLQIK